MSRDTEQSPAPDELARLLPAYDVECILAQRQTATTYRGRQAASDRPVVIKLLKWKPGEEESGDEWFRACARVLLRLCHPNVVAVYDAGEVAGMPFLVLESLEAAPLSGALQGEPVDSRQAAQLIAAVCRGLEYAHRAGIVLGRLSPENILIDARANPKIDSSCALETETADGRTSAYSAPESTSARTNDPRSDVYACGMLFYELLAGKLPDAERTPPSRLSGSPIQFDEIVRMATESEPEARYETAAVMAKDVERAFAEAGAEAAATAVPAVLRAPDSAAREKASAAALPDFVPVPPSALGESRSPVQAVGLWIAYALKVAAIVALLGAGAYFARPYIERFLADSEAEEGPEQAVDYGEIEPLVDEKPEVEAEPEPRLNTEAILASLSELEERLASGARDVFPEGTVAHGESHFLVVGHPLHWAEAAKFAESHGAHLAVLASEEDRAWFCESFGDTAGSEEIWVGAGAAPGGRWLWVDGTAWTAEQFGTSPSDLDQRIAIATAGAGEWVAANGRESRAFALEWRNDGENPGSILAQLRRTGADLQAQEPETARYPVGTLERRDSRYVLLPGSWPWDEARQLAQEAGGRLAAAASAEEAQWYRSAFREFLDGGGSFWLGGYKMKAGSPWRWISREAWKHSEWLEGHPGEDPACNRLLLIGQTSGQAGWHASAGTAGEAQAMLIEWSEATADEPGDFDLDEWLAGVNRTLRIRVAPDIKKQEQERKDALTEYSRAVKRTLRSGAYTAFRGRGFGGNAGRILEETLDDHLDEVRAAGEIVDMPNTVPQEFRNLQMKAREDLEALDKAHAAAMQAHLDFYRQGLSKKAEDLFVTGYTDDSAKLKKYIESTPDVGTFTAAIQL